MKICLKISALVILITVIFLGVSGYQLFSSPSTAEMKNHFFEHQKSFEQINREILTALSQRTDIPSGKDTKAVCQWLKIHPEPETYQDGTPVNVSYYTHVKGIGVSSFGTGIAYLDPTRPEKRYSSLEEMTADKNLIEGFIGYSHIIGNWYSFFWEAD